MIFFFFFFCSSLHPALVCIGGVLVHSDYIFLAKHTLWMNRQFTGEGGATTSQN